MAERKYVPRSNADGGVGKASKHFADGYIDDLYVENLTATGDVNAVGVTATAYTGVTGSMVANTPTGNITSTTVQDAINELDIEKIAKPSSPSVGMTLIFNGTDWVTWNQMVGRNKLINGNFAVNQEGVSGTVTLTAGTYGHDGWKAGSSGCTYTFATAENVTTITITAGTLLQVVEGINLQSGTHVLSWTGTATGRINSGSYSASGVTGTATGGTNLTVEFGTGTLSKVQFEKGSIATVFEERPYGLELNLCKRYLEIISISQRGYSVGGNYIYGIPINWTVQKRTTPTVTNTGYTDRTNISTVSISLQTVYGARYTVTVAATGTYSSTEEIIKADARL
ncbi:MAG: putative phage tail protein [Firmicutes bacterium]|nr:putative phage tail protein [Bacillota bacterium]